MPEFVTAGLQMKLLGGSEDGGGGRPQIRTQDDTGGVGVVGGYGFHHQESEFPAFVQHKRWTTDDAIVDVNNYSLFLNHFSVNYYYFLYSTILNNHRHTQTHTQLLSLPFVFHIFFILTYLSLSIIFIIYLLLCVWSSMCCCFCF